jgi:hypothetical protein
MSSTLSIGPACPRDVTPACQHLMRKAAAEPGRRVYMQIDDPGHDNLAGDVHDLPRRRGA